MTYTNGERANGRVHDAGDGTTLVTGAAGFIGFHVAHRLLEQGHAVVGVDNLNDYYDVGLKEARLEQLRPYERFAFVRLDLADRAGTAALFAERPFVRVVHLAAQPGVRHSFNHPHAYVDSNLVAFVNVLEGCRHAGVEHLVFASSSSVYGDAQKVPFSESDPVDHPVSLYAATKKANELIAHAYSHLYNLPTTGLRFFTVYGPWGRPDMAYFLFTKAILCGRPIRVFNRGRMMRDFTYIDDAVEGIVRILERPPSATGADGGGAPYALYNVGNNRPIQLLHFIQALETVLGREAEKEFLPMQSGDALRTCADVERLMEATGYRPTTPLEVGLSRFADWYAGYHTVQRRLPLASRSAS